VVTTGPDFELEPLPVPPQLRTLESADGRRAGYLELFFDLVFVVAIKLRVAHQALRAA